MSGGDPVRLGLVANLNRPGGNLTGVSILAGDLTAKRFGLFRDLVPQAAVIGVLADSTNPRGEFQLQEAQAAASSLAVPIWVMSAGSESEIEAAFAGLAREGVTALFVVNGFLFYSLSDRLTALAARHRIALSGELRVFVEFGRLDVLRAERTRSISTGGPLYRPYPQGREAGRLAGHAADQDRLRHQPQKREGARARNSTRYSQPPTRSSNESRREFITSPRRRGGVADGGAGAAGDEGPSYRVSMG